MLDSPGQANKDKVESANSEVHGYDVFCTEDKQGICYLHAMTICRMMLAEQRMVSDDWVQYNFLYIFTFRIEDSLAVFLIACNLDLEGGEVRLLKER